MKPTSSGDWGDLPLFSTPPKSGAAAAEASAPRAWTITELTQRIKGVLEPGFTQVWVQGEVSNLRPSAAGHLYFSLKDSGASISAAVFGWGSRSFQKNRFEMKDGLQVLCRGKVTVYVPRGTYQITVEQIEPMGAGALQLAFEQLKAKLAQEGLFDPSRKQALPRFPSRVAVITSPSGAAIQDMLNILRRRAPQIRVTVIPAMVQGDEAPAQILRGLEHAAGGAYGEVIVLARGGGSIEDLWAFNDERLARAIAACPLPVISAVGHEIDFTIADFVADLRAPTPSAAAEIVSHHWMEARSIAVEARQRLVASQVRALQVKRAFFNQVAARLVSPRDRLRERMQRCDELSARLERALRARLDRMKGALGKFSGELDALSPLRVLERGYSMVRTPGEEGALIRSAHQVSVGQRLEITFHDGKKQVQAI